jgi:hypothetical protein
MLILSFLLLGVYAGITSFRPQAGEVTLTLAERSCPGAKVHEAGMLQLNTDFDPSNRCQKFLNVNAGRFYQMVALIGNVVFKA